MNSIFIVNTFVIIGIIICAILAVAFEKLLLSVIAFSLTGLFMVLEFILLHAPDVAMAEAAVSLIFTPFIFIIALRKIKEGRE